MTTSGVTALDLSARDVIAFALGEVGANPIGQDVETSEAEPVLLKLNMMLMGWMTRGPHLWRVTEGSVPITSNTPSYSLSVDNPLRLIECRLRYADGHDMPMMPMTRIQYMTLPVKTSQGFSTQWYFDPQEATQSLFVWPLLASPTTERLVYSYQRRFQICQSLNDSVDVPEEWLETVGYNLAKRLLTRYGLTGEIAQRISDGADQLLRAAKAFDRPSFLNFKPSYRFRA